MATPSVRKDLASAPPAGWPSMIAGREGARRARLDYIHDREYCPDVAKRGAAAERAERGLDTSELVLLFKALSDRSRVRIVGLLSRRELCVGEIEYLLGLSQTNVSRHLDRLRRAALVCSRKQAQWVYYRLSAETLERIPTLEKLIRGEVSASEACAQDLASLLAYERSGLTCSELPNCGSVKAR